WSAAPEWVGEWFKRSCRSSLKDELKGEARTWTAGIRKMEIEQVASGLESSRALSVNGAEGDLPLSACAELNYRLNKLREHKKPGVATAPTESPIDAVGFVTDEAHGRVKLRTMRRLPVSLQDAAPQRANA